jgi:hypothetical protein
MTYDSKRFWWRCVCRHIKRVLVHKWFVILAVHRLPFPDIDEVGFWQMMRHDLSKFSKIERRGYTLNFYFRAFAWSDQKSMEDIDTAWKNALRHHYRSNPHHWQYWCDDTYRNPVPMPLRYVREMVADWLAASRAYEGYWPPSTSPITGTGQKCSGYWPWLEKNWHRMQLHPETRTEVISLLARMYIQIPPFSGENV